MFLSGYILRLMCISRISTVSTDHESEAAKPVANEDIVSKLADMGFNYFHCQKAAINTSNVGVEEAMTWLLSHMDDPGLLISEK